MKEDNYRLRYHNTKGARLFLPELEDEIKMIREEYKNEPRNKKYHTELPAPVFKAIKESIIKKE